MNKYFSVLIVMFVSVLSPTWVISEDITVESVVNTQQIPLGSAINLSIVINGTQDVTDLNLPNIDGFDKKYIGPSRNISIVNNKYTSSIAFNYSMLPLRTGALLIPSFQIVIDGQAYKTQEITINVTDANSSGAIENVTKLDEKIFIQLQTSKTKGYINEPIVLKVYMYYSDLAVRDIQYPKIELLGFIDEPYKQPKQYQQVLDGKRYEIIEFQKVVYPTRTGMLQIGPAQLDCNIIVRSGGRKSSLFDDDFFSAFFDRGEKRQSTLTSETLNIEISDLPVKNRPDDFAGSVGNFNFSASVSPMEVRVGDPITLKMKIQGQGNLKAVKFPEVVDTQNFKLYDPIIKEDGRSKTLEQVLIPRTDAVTEIPELSFSYFNNKLDKYLTIAEGPFPITVEKAQQDGGLTVVGLNSQPIIMAPETLGKDIVFIKDSPGQIVTKGRRVYHSLLYHLIIGLIISAFVGSHIWYRITHKLETDISFAKKVKAPKEARKKLKLAKQYIYENKTDEFYNALFKLLQHYFSHKLLIPAGTVSVKEIQKADKNNSIDEDIYKEIKTVLQECESIRYALADVSEGQMTASHQSVVKIIDYFERNFK